MIHRIATRESNYSSNGSFDVTLVALVALVVLRFNSCAMQEPEEAFHVLFLKLVVVMLFFDVLFLILFCLCYRAAEEIDPPGVAEGTWVRGAALRCSLLDERRKLTLF